MSTNERHLAEPSDFAVPLKHATASKQLRPEVLALFSVVLGSVGQLLVKAALLLIGPGFGGAGRSVLIESAAGILFGLAVYAVGTWFWFRAVARASISYLYPLSASSYVLVAMGGHFMFNEQIQPSRWLGIGVITLGVGLLAFASGGTRE